MAKIFHFFQKNFLKKMKIFGNFFLKKCQVLGNFLTVKWQFPGGSAYNYDDYIRDKGNILLKSRLLVLDIQVLA